MSPKLTALDLPSKIHRDMAFNSLKFAATVAVAAIEQLPLPGVGAVAYLLNEIINTIETAHFNKADAQCLAGELSKHLDAIRAACSFATENQICANALDRFSGNIQTMIRTLEEIQQGVKEIGSRSWVKRVFSAGKDKRFVSDTKQKLQSAVDRFVAVNSMILVQEVRGFRKVSEMSVERLEDKLGRIQDALDLGFYQIALQAAQFNLDVLQVYQPQQDPKSRIDKFQTNGDIFPLHEPVFGPPDSPVSVQDFSSCIRCPITCSPIESEPALRMNGCKGPDPKYPDGDYPEKIALGDTHTTIMMRLIAYVRGFGAWRRT